MSIKDFSPMQGVTMGRIVHYVYSGSDVDAEHQALIGVHRPAIVVRVWPSKHGSANLRVFTDGDNDGMASDWVTSRVYSENAEPGTWHWPERA